MPDSPKEGTPWERKRSDDPGENLARIGKMLYGATLTAAPVILEDANVGKYAKAEAKALYAAGVSLEEIEERGLPTHHLLI